MEFGCEPDNTLDGNSKDAGRVMYGAGSGGEFRWVLFSGMHQQDNRTRYSFILRAWGEFRYLRFCHLAVCLYVFGSGGSREVYEYALYFSVYVLLGPVVLCMGSYSSSLGLGSSPLKEQTAVVLLQ